jgi:hypothetical protein
MFGLFNDVVPPAYIKQGPKVERLWIVNTPVVTSGTSTIPQLTFRGWRKPRRPVRIDEIRNWDLRLRIRRINHATATLLICFYGQRKPVDSISPTTHSHRDCLGFSPRISLSQCSPAAYSFSAKFSELNVVLLSGSAHDEPQGRGTPLWNYWIEKTENML